MRDILFSLMAKGFKKPLTFDDLYDLPSRDKTAQVYPVLEREWIRAQQSMVSYLYHYLCYWKKRTGILALQ